MPLNKEGIAQLKADLRSHARSYEQETFGRVRKVGNCGTECCIAGLCLMRTIGYEAFTALVRSLDSEAAFSEAYEAFSERCLIAGAQQLGLSSPNLAEWATGEDMPDIFNTSDSWPADLAEAMDEAETADDYAAKVEVACQALDRMDDMGNLSYKMCQEDDDAVK